MGLALTVPDDHAQISWLVRAANAAGIGNAEMAGAIGLCEAALGENIVLVSSDQYRALLAYLNPFENELITEAFIAELNRIDQFGLLGYICENSPDVGAWIDNLAHYFPLFAKDGEVELIRSDAGAVISYRPVGVEAEEVGADVVLTFVGVVSNLRRHLRPDWMPRDCAFAIPEPPWSERLSHLLGLKPRFGAAFSGIVVAAEDLPLPIAGADPFLLTVLRQQADALLSRSGAFTDLYERLKAIITANLADPAFDVAAAARALNTSDRTLLRRLAERGATFRQLRNELVHATACHALRDPSVSVTEIAHRLGYAETSSFSRAFAKIAGRSPRAYRRAITS